jgi:Ca2+:H+ antiporter
METFFIVLLGFVPATIIAHMGGYSPVFVFFLSALAIIPLAKFIGEATEELSSQTSPAWGGLLGATFGNAVELIIGIFALRAGLFEVVKASITGSIIGNLLLVLGMAMFCGGLKREKQTFNKTGALVGASTLFIAAIALVMPALFVGTAPLASASVVQSLSILVSLALMCIYVAGLFFSLRTHKHLFTEELGEYKARWSKLVSVVVLFAATLATAYMSDILVGTITPLTARLGWTDLFIGVIVIAIIGNVAEHTAAITLAIKNRMDLVLQISIGSATQIAMLIAPVLVLASVLMHRPMSLVFNIFELVSIVLSVLIVNVIVMDGESNWLEGAQLVAAYAIIAVAFFFHP